MCPNILCLNFFLNFHFQNTQGMHYFLEQVVVTQRVHKCHLLGTLPVPSHSGGVLTQVWGLLNSVWNSFSITSPNSINYWTIPGCRLRAFHLGQLVWREPYRGDGASMPVVSLWWNSFYPVSFASSQMGSRQAAFLLLGKYHIFCTCEGQSLAPWYVFELRLSLISNVKYAFKKIVKQTRLSNRNQV